MIHSTDEETKTQKDLFVHLAHQPSLLDTFYDMRLALCSRETVMCAGQTDIL